MKTLTLLSALFALTLVLPQARAEEENDSEYPGACYAFLVEGDDITWARVECDADYAGKCLKGVTLPNGKFEWQALPDEQCAELVK